MCGGVRSCVPGGVGMLWMSYLSCAGYGYAYARSVRCDEMITLERTTLTARVALAGEQWWVSKRRRQPVCRWPRGRPPTGKIEVY